MQSIPSGTGKGRYLIRSNDPGLIAAFINSIRQDPSIEMVDTIGPPGQPHTVVISTSHDRARALELHFRTTKNQLTIEPDRPLSLFDTM